MEITTRMTIAQTIPASWAHSNPECTLENGEEDEEFDKASLTRAIAGVAGGMEGALKPGPAKGYCGRV